MTEAEIIDRLWQDSPLFLTREQFGQTLQGWEIHRVHGAAGLAGVVITKGPEFHFSKFDPHYQVTRADLARWPGDLIAKYGYALTRTPKDDTRQHRFNARLGFVKVGEDQYDIHLRITRMRGKDQSCPL
jgi:hypothetical protein